MAGAVGLSAGLGSPEIRDLLSKLQLGWSTAFNAIRPIFDSAVSGALPNAPQIPALPNLNPVNYSAPGMPMPEIPGMSALPLLKGEVPTAELPQAILDLFKLLLPGIPLPAAALSIPALAAAGMPNMNASLGNLNLGSLPGIGQLPSANMPTMPGMPNLPSIPNVSLPNLNLPGHPTLPSVIEPQIPGLNISLADMEKLFALQHPFLEIGEKIATGELVVSAEQN